MIKCWLFGILLFRLGLFRRGLFRIILFLLMFTASAMDRVVRPSVDEVLREYFDSGECKSVVHNINIGGFYFCNFWGREFEDEDERFVALCYEVAFRGSAVRLEVQEDSFARIKYDNLHGLFLSLTKACNEASRIEDRFRIVRQILQKHTLERNCKVRECERNLYEVIRDCYRGLSMQFEYRIASKARRVIAQKEDVRWREPFERLLKTLSPKNR